MTCIDSRTTITDLLEQRAGESDDVTFCHFEGQTLSVRQINEAANRLANGLIRRGVCPGDRVAVMLPNHPDHIVAMLALIKLRAVWVPINVRLRGASLSYIVSHCDPRAIIVDARYRESIEPVLVEHRPPLVIQRGSGLDVPGGDLVDFGAVLTTDSVEPSDVTATAGDVICINYTSGTTGEPKGVLVTDKMLRAAAMGAILGGDIQDNDTLLLWEPLYHIAGSEVIIVALQKKITIALLERFSASRFWDEVARHGATHIHYVGGILQMLLKQPPGVRDADTSVRVAWGGGCTPEVWREFEQRFGVRIREVYGLTEASSISTINAQGRVGSIGTSAPYFDVTVVDDAGNPVPSGAMGEIVIGEKEPGLLMPGYFRNDAATGAALRDGRLHTGDLGRMDEDSFLYYAGRKTDSVRHRGENVSAWEVEQIVNEHSDVELSALVGVTAEIGEQDLKIVIKPVPGRRPDPAEFIRWCQARMPLYQVPRYVAFIDDFEVTPTQRIRKETLSRATDDCWDRESSASAATHQDTE